MLSNTCKYAIRATIYLAIKDDGINKVGIKQISNDLNLPTPFLGKIMQTLAKQKLLASTKGPHGGFSLNKPADEIFLLDIVRIIDGLDIFQECMVGLKVCEKRGNQDDCPFHKKSDTVRQQMFDLFEKQSIGDLAKGVKTVDDILGL